MTEAVVDVRDMLCSQALAVVDRALRATASGAILDIRCNADDVTHDLQVWAADRGHRVLSAEARAGETWLRIRRA